MFKSQSSETRFWEWFQRNANQLKSVRTGREPILAELHGKLKRVHKDLVFEIGTNESGIHEFIVSADGIKSTVPHVEKLVASSPEIPGWRIIQFRPRKHGMEVLIQGRKVSEDTIFFNSQQNGEKLDLWLYLDGLNNTNARELMGACFIFLDATVGEYDVMTKIGNIEFLPLIEADGRQRPLKDLASIVDNMKANTSHNPSS